MFYLLFFSFRHGSPANLPKGQPPERVEFANYYLKAFSGKFLSFFLHTIQAIIFY
jgi:hypothetical protein